MTILVEPTAQVNLDHIAQHFSGVLGCSGLAVASEEGSITLIGSDLKAHVTINRREKIQSISLHPTKPLLAIVEGRNSHLSFIDLNNLSAQDTLPFIAKEHWHPNFNLPGACCFTSNGRYLWHIAAYSADDSDNENEERMMEIRLLECDTWHLVDKAIIKDPYGDSHLWLYEAADSEKIALWLVGRHGEQVYWLTKEINHITYTSEFRDMTYPVFSASGQEFLSVDGKGTLSKYQFPDVQLLSVHQLPCLEEQDDNLGFQLCYIGDKRALAVSSKQRLFLLDLAQMTVLDEVVLAGHEPQPISLYYQGITDNIRRWANIRDFKRCGDTIVFIARRDGGYGVTHWKDALFFFTGAALTTH